MGFFSKIKEGAKKVAGKVKAVVKKIPEKLQQAKNFVPKIREGISRVGAMVDLLPDAAKGPLKSALSKAESLTDKAESTVDKGMQMVDIATGGGGNAEAAGGEGEGE